MKVPNQEYISINLFNQLPGKVPLDLTELLNAVNYIKNVVQNTSTKVNQTEKHLRSLTKNNQNTNSSTSGCIVKWSWTPPTTAHLPVLDSGCDLSGRLNAPEAKHVIGDVGFIHCYKPQFLFK